MSDETERQRAPRRRALRVAIICFVVSTLFFAGGGIVVVDRSLRGAFVPWEKAEPPAGRPLELRLGENGEVLLETVEGQFYMWDQYSNSFWQAVEEPARSGPYWASCGPRANDYFAVPNPPGRVRQRIEATCPSPAYASHYEVSLLENDELWSWSYSSTRMLGAVYKGIIVVGGIGLSLLSGGLAYILGSISWRRGG
jgi:hypothetical protein